MQEAQYMIQHNSVSVYTIGRSPVMSHISHTKTYLFFVDGVVTTIVAVTRCSASVAGMTKVYTTPRYRGRGCAGKLVAHVCQRLVSSLSPPSILLQRPVQFQNEPKLTKRGPPTSQTNRLWDGKCRPVRRTYPLRRKSLPSCRFRWGRTRQVLAIHPRRRKLARNRVS
jgi:hypothetical protein